MIFSLILFLISLLLLLHSYLFYPLSVWLLNKLLKKSFSADRNSFPNLSIIISVFNEEKVIENTIRNFLLSDYDLNKIEFIIGSDNSTDKTNQIVEKLSQEIPSIKFYPFNVRRGKSQVLNDLVEKSSSDILVFSDANTIYKANALKNLVRFYADEKVGGISGKLVLIENKDIDTSANQEKIYWDLETQLKKFEGKLGILIGANGGIYSIRKKCFHKIPSEYPVMDDFYISLKVLEKGKAFLYLDDAIAEEYVAPSIKSEFYRKIRNNSIMMSTIRAIKSILNPKYGLISYSLWSHKIIRWFSPVLLLVLLISNSLLFSYNNFFNIFLYIQVFFYSLGIIGYIFDKLNIYFKPINICYYFIMTNIAMLIGIIKFLQKKQTSFWQSTART